MSCIGEQNCSGTVVARGLCGKHYQRWRKTGSPVGIKPNPGNRKPRPVPAERICRVCGVSSKERKFKLKTNICVPCDSAYKTAWCKANPEKVKEYRDRGNARWELRSRARKLGIDPDFIERYVAEHDGRCEVCRRKPLDEGDARGLYLDHCHETGGFRGLLCNNCNGGLGRFKDDPTRLWNAIRYLVRAGIAPPGDLAGLLLTKAGLRQ